MLDSSQIRRVLESTFPEECEDVGSPNLAKISSGVTQTVASAGGQSVSVGDSAQFLIQMVAFVSDVAGIAALYIAVKAFPQLPEEMLQRVRESGKRPPNVTEEQADQIAFQVFRELEESQRKSSAPHHNKPSL